VSSSLAAPPPAPVRFGFRFVAPLALGSVLNPINSTMISTALVPIGRDLHASASQTGWLIAGLYLASAVAQPVMGDLADRVGARRVYLATLALVAIAGLIGWWAPSLMVLIGVRILLGVGTSGAYPSAMRLFRTEAGRAGLPPPRRAMGVLSLAAIATMVVGPFLGGVLTGAFGWHAIFSVNLPLALLAMALSVLWLPSEGEGEGEGERESEGEGEEGRRPADASPRAGLDVAGIVLFTAFLLCLMLFLMQLDQPRWWLLPLAALAGAALVAHSRRHRQPFIDMPMLAANPALIVTYARMGLLSVVPYTILYGIGQWLEASAGLGAAAAGLIMLPLSGVSAAGALLGARTRSIRLAFLLAAGAGVAGCCCLLLVDHTTPPWLIAVALMVFGAPQGLASTATQAAIYLQAPAGAIGNAAGLQRTAAYVGAILAASLLARLFGHHPSDAGLHHLALAVGAISAVLLIATLFDRTLPRSIAG